VQTNRFGRHRHFVRVAYWVGLGAGCLALAGCVTNDTVASRVGTARDVAVNAPENQQVAKTVPVTPKRHAATAAPDVLQTGYSAVGMASWYGADFHGRRTAAGETFNMNSLTAAHPTLPLPCTVRVTNLANHRSLVLRVNDRGPYVGHRVIDVSAKSAQLLGFYDHGLAKVKVEYVGRATAQSALAP
jgi:rare lipoprotein A